MLNSLFVTRGNDSGKSFTVADKTISIGRDRSNSIRLDDDEVSRHHCSIIVDDRKTLLIDENSSNGTYLNGDPIERSELHKGDRIRIGRTQFIFDSFLQIAIDPNHHGPKTASPTRFAHSSTAQTRFIGPGETESQAISLKLDTDDDSTYEKLLAKEGEVQAKQRFVQVKNDLRFVYRASLATSRTLDTPKMLHELMELIFDWVEADRGCVFLKSEQTNNFEVRYVKQRQKNDSAKSSKSGPETDVQINQAIVDYVIQERVGVLSPNNDRDFRQQVSKGSTHPRINEVICVPIEGRGELLGLLYVDNLAFGRADLVSGFNTDHLRLMLAMAHQAAVAIENEAFYRAQIKKERLSAIGEVTEMMSHRINNILQGLNGGSHLVQSGLDSNDLSVCRNGWEIAQRNQLQISQLVMDLLVLSKPYEPYKADCDLTKVIRSAITTVSEEMVASPINCEFESDGQWRVLIDQTGIQTAFESLIRVAARNANVSESDCPIRLTLQRNDSAFQIRVNCIGFSIGNSFVAAKPSLHAPDESPKIANPMPDSMESNAQDGGLEFAVSKKIVEAHGGSIEVQEPEQGTMLRIELPYPE